VIQTRRTKIVKVTHKAPHFEFFVSPPD